MPVHQELCENGRILQVTFTDPWMVKEMTDLFPQAQQFYDSAAQKIHMLINMQSRHGTQGALRASYSIRRRRSTGSIMCSTRSTSC